MLQIIKDHINFRFQIIELAKADLIKTYRGAALGWIWALIKPLSQVFVFWFVLKVGLRADSIVGDAPFLLWLIVGLVPWFYVSDMLDSGTNAIKKYRYLVTKMSFPVSTVPTFVSMSNLFVHVVMVVLALVILSFNGYPPTIYYLQLPVYILLLFGFFTMWSLFAAPLAAISKDFQNLVKSASRILFWMSGILYSIGAVDQVWLRDLLLINPITFFVEGYRKTFLYHEWFFDDIKQLVIFLIVYFIMIGLALFTYKRLRKEIVDVL